MPPLVEGKERKGFFLSIGARRIPPERLFAPAIEVVRAMFFSLNVAYAGELVFAGVDEWGAIKNVPGALEKAYEAGKSFVS